MEQLIEGLRSIQQDELIEKLLSADYAFAKWAMPKSNKEVLLVSMTRPSQLENRSISDMDAGFLVNRFEDQHPEKPFYMKADIVFENESIAIDPRLNASELENFEKNILSAPIRNPHTEILPKEYENDFKKTVAKAIDEIKKGTFNKVVLSRYKNIALPKGFSIGAFFKSILKQYPNAFRSLVHLPDQGLWMGATPELLISDDGNAFSTHALAGTKKLDEGQPLSSIAWTQKEIEEQAMVSRYIINCFKKIRLREFDEVGPKSVRAGNLAHLKTTYKVDLQKVMFDNLSGQMLSLLHPTSAVCGMPLDNSKAFIKKHEQYDREFFTGFLGPVNFKGATNLFVNLRCMQVMGSFARFYAGAGITEDSDPDKEWEETELKMNILASLI